jgi:hypothetical protein
MLARRWQWKGFAYRGGSAFSRLPDTYGPKNRSSQSSQRYGCKRSNLRNDRSSRPSLRVYRTFRLPHRGQVFFWGKKITLIGYLLDPTNRGNYGHSFPVFRKALALWLVKWTQGYRTPLSPIFVKVIILLPTIDSIRHTKQQVAHDYAADEAQQRCVAAHVLQYIVFGTAVTPLEQCEESTTYGPTS